MKNLIHTAVVTLFAASAAQAQQAVQWKVSDGGNGHWYRFVIDAGTFWDKQHQAVTRGGHLVTLQSQAENDLIAAMVTAESWQTACWVTLGGYQEPGAVEPAGGWRWVTDEPFSFTHWHANEPNNQGAENFLEYWRFDCGFSWNDGGNPPATEAFPYVIEWDGDCNSDGVVDYGQILQGQLADNDVDGIPDICQQPTCVDADIYRDFNVNGADLGILLSQWGPNTPLTESDINKDGFVNGADLGIMLSFWGACPN